MVTNRYPSLASEHWMVSLGDAVHRPRLIEKVFCGDLKRRLQVSGPVMLDSGGFTMMMQNRSLEISEIARIYERTHAELCVSLDIPPGSADDRRTRIQKYEETRANLAFLAERLAPLRLVPVIHGKTPVEIGTNCQLVTRIIQNPKMVCIGGLVPLLRRAGGAIQNPNTAFKAIGRSIATIRTWFPRTLIHVLGAGSPQNIRQAIRCGADSTDSIAWRRAAGFGTIYLPGTGERFLQDRGRSRPNSRPTLSATELELLMECKCPACGDCSNDRVKALSKSYLARAAHNAFVILQEATAAAR